MYPFKTAAATEPSAVHFVEGCFVRPLDNSRPGGVGAEAETRGFFGFKVMRPEAAAEVADCGGSARQASGGGDADGGGGDS
jgi:hypothetical protein